MRARAKADAHGKEMVADADGNEVVADADGDDVVADAVEALTWLRWLGPDDADILRARLEGVPWKLICWRFGISRPTAHRRYDYALSVIAWRLNGRQVHHRRGRRFVVARAG